MEEADKPRAMNMRFSCIMLSSDRQALHLDYGCVCTKREELKADDGSQTENSRRLRYGQCTRLCERAATCTSL